MAFFSIWLRIFIAYILLSALVWGVLFYPIRYVLIEWVGYNLSPDLERTLAIGLFAAIASFFGWMPLKALILNAYWYVFGKNPPK